EIETNKESLQAAIKQTKSKVLDLAIKGRLVSQNPNDEPAKIDSIEITDDIPFELPNNWKWVKGADIFKPMQSIKPEGDCFYYVDIDAIDNKKNVISAPKYLKVDKAPSRARRQVSNGDILFSMVRPYLRNIAKVDKDNYIASTGFFVCKPNNNITSNFCFYLMISDYVVNGLNQYMKGDNSPSINNENIQQFLFPLPPLSEQTRIVSKIEEVFALLDEIERELE
ncbi:MAG: restriction endonuclease subunit S, partial [Bacteroidales bacterium]|nr:restriction endonuclease subunit S [Bacteroidales bacterium]